MQQWQMQGDERIIAMATASNDCKKNRPGERRQRRRRYLLAVKMGGGGDRHAGDFDAKTK
jgi:hypothetical protein